MKRIMTILLLTIATTANAQTLRKVFVNMPDSIVPLLSSVNRQDGMDYVTNKLGNITTISGEKNRYIDISTASKAWTRLLLLPTTQGDTLICMVKTVSIDKARDSQIHFYNKEWTNLRTTDFVDLPPIGNFMSFNDSINEEDRAELMRRIDIKLMEISANYEKDDAQQDIPTLTFTLHSQAYMNEEDQKLITPFIKGAIRMRWNGSRFE